MKLDEAAANCTDSDEVKTLCYYRPNVENVEKEGGSSIRIMDSWPINCESIAKQAKKKRSPDWRYIEMLIPNGSGCPKNWKNYNQRREEIRPVSDVVDICAAGQIGDYQLCSYWIGLKNLEDGSRRPNQPIRSLNEYVARDMECTNDEGIIDCSDMENPDV